MPAFLPPNLLALFAPRPALAYVKPHDKLPIDKPRDGKYAYDGCAEWMNKFESAEEQPLPIREETKEERRQRIRKLKLDEHKKEMQDELLEWDPNKNKDSTVDPYKTLFIAKLDYTTTEKRIFKEFEQFGRIDEVKLVLDKRTGQSRGYAFVEFRSEKDMRYAYKHGDRIKIDGRKILVDVERGRTVEGWRPRRFGGGLGETRKEKKKGEKKKVEVNTISLFDHVGERGPARSTFITNHRYNKYDAEDRGGGKFDNFRRGQEATGPSEGGPAISAKKYNESDNRARFHIPKPKHERGGLQYSRGGFDFGDGGFFGTDKVGTTHKFDSRSGNWKGNKDRGGDGNKNLDEALGGPSAYADGKQGYESRDDRHPRRRPKPRAPGLPSGTGLIDESAQLTDQRRPDPLSYRTGQKREADTARDAEQIAEYRDYKKKKRDYDNDGWGGGLQNGKVGGRYNVGRIAAFGTRDLNMTPRYKEVKRE